MIQNSSSISQDALNSVHFNQHSRSKIFNVAHVPVALSLECILSLLGYANSTVYTIDILGNHLTISNKEQLSVCLGWVEDDINTYEDFLGFYKIPDLVQTL